MGTLVTFSYDELCLGRFLSTFPSVKTSSNILIVHRISNTWVPFQDSTNKTLVRNQVTLMKRVDTKFELLSLVFVISDILFGAGRKVEVTLERQNFCCFPY